MIFQFYAWYQYEYNGISQNSVAWTSRVQSFRLERLTVRPISFISFVSFFLIIKQKTTRKTTNKIDNAISNIVSHSEIRLCNQQTYSFIKRTSEIGMLWQNKIHYVFSLFLFDGWMLMSVKKGMVFSNDHVQCELEQFCVQSRWIWKKRIVRENRLNSFGNSKENDESWN